VKQRLHQLHKWLISSKAATDTTNRVNPRKFNPDHGASLVEVMVAMVISAVLLASIIGLLDSSSQAARSMETRAEINERSSVLQNRLGAVLRGAVSLTFATEICTSARSRQPIDNVTTVSATAFTSAPRDTCVRVDGSTIQSVTTTSGSPSSELILNGATGSAFTYFNADGEQLSVDPETSHLAATDLTTVRRVVFSTTVSDRLGRTTENLQIQFALGSARFSAEQSWRGRAGFIDEPVTISGAPG
jgi:type II secretory pathway pseudopilin PulG